MAPSPTGPLHIGTARTALFNWLFARHMGGTFVLRVEDTDAERSKKEYEDELLEGLRWLGLNWDEGALPAGSEKGAYGPYRQSERLAIYKKYLQQLLAAGSAYYCYCTKEELEAQKQDMVTRGLPPKYNGHCRSLTAAPSKREPQVIRFKTPEVEVEFKDMIRGTVKFDATLFGDMVIARLRQGSGGQAKNLDTPLYNFAVVVDDELMEISHVIRGEDHLTNTPKQILMQRALGFKEPRYAHLPLILNADRSKMSKRFADTAVADYREKGYLPDALTNFLALLGWHPQDDQEFLTRAELIEKFDIARVQKSSAVFDQAKLDWLNREYVKRIEPDTLVELVRPFFEKASVKASPELIAKTIAAAQTRAVTLEDFVEQGRFFFELPDYTPALLVWKNMQRENVSPMLHLVRDALSGALFDGFTREELSALLEKLTAEHKKGEIFWPLRVALSGLAASPDPVEIMMVLGKEETLRRIDIAIQKIETPR